MAKKLTQRNLYIKRHSHFRNWNLIPYNKFIIFFFPGAQLKVAMEHSTTFRHVGSKINRDYSQNSRITILCQHQPLDLHLMYNNPYFEQRVMIENAGNPVLVVNFNK